MHDGVASRRQCYVHIVIYDLSTAPRGRRIPDGHPGAPAGGNIQVRAESRAPNKRSARGNTGRREPSATKTSANSMNLAFSRRVSRIDRRRWSEKKLKGRPGEWRSRIFFRENFPNTRDFSREYFRSRSRENSLCIYDGALYVAGRESGPTRAHISRFWFA